RTPSLPAPSIFLSMLRPPPRPPLFPYTTLFRSAAAQRVVRLREPVVPEDPESRERTIGGIRGEERGLGVALLEVLHDHRGLRQEPRVLLHDRDAPRAVLLVDPRRAVREVDLDRLELDVLLREDDAHAGAVGTTCGVV